MMVRTFISVRMPDVAALQPVLDSISGLGNVKPSPIQQLHITLRFIGDVDEKRIPEVVGCVRRACDGTGPFTVDIEGAGCFPNSKRPSVVWVGARSGGNLETLSERISEELSGKGFDFDDKPFKGHITVGRCRGPVDVSPVLDEYGSTRFSRFECNEVLVMKSVLGPSGAKHSVMERIALVPY